MTTSTSPDARQIWGAAKGPALIGLVILVGSIIAMLLATPGEGGSLDPRSVTPPGSRALARVLEAEGVKVEYTDTATGSLTGATLLVTHPDLVDPARLESLSAQAEDVVLVAPQSPPAGVRVSGVSDVEDRQPGCTYASRFGVASMGGVQYTADGESCYGSTLVRKNSLTVLGSGRPLSNEALDEQGNAALAMTVLGENPRLVWYVPSIADPTRQRSLVDLVPVGWKFGAIQLAVAVVLFALWRARRLGPLVTERLPVVVRAAETVEGRARLYRRARAVPHAAATLRQAARDRMVPLLGLPADASPAAVADEVARRSSRSADEVMGLLYGPAPADDRALVRLIDELDVLENEVR